MRNYYEEFLSETRRKATDKTDKSPSVSKVSLASAYIKRDSAIRPDSLRPCARCGYKCSPGLNGFCIICEPVDFPNLEDKI